MSPASSVQLDSGVDSHVLNLDDEDAAFSVLRKPQMVNAVDKVGVNTFCFQQCLATADVDKDAIMAKVLECAQFCIGSDKKDVHASTTAVKSGDDEWDWQFPNVPEQQQPFDKVAVYKRHLVSVIEVGKHDISMQAMPLAGCACIIKATSVNTSGV